MRLTEARTGTNNHAPLCVSLAHQGSPRTQLRGHSGRSEVWEPPHTVRPTLAARRAVAISTTSRHVVRVAVFSLLGRALAGSKRGQRSDCCTVTKL